MGRGRKKNPELANKIQDLFNKKLSAREIADELGISIPTVYSYIKKFGLKGKKSVSRRYISVVVKVPTGLYKKAKIKAIMNEVSLTQVLLDFLRDWTNYKEEENIKIGGTI